MGASEEGWEHLGGHLCPLEVSVRKSSVQIRETQVSLRVFLGRELWMNSGDLVSHVRAVGEGFR